MAEKRINIADVYLPCKSSNGWHISKIETKDPAYPDNADRHTSKASHLVSLYLNARDHIETMQRGLDNLHQLLLNHDIQIFLDE